MCPCAFSLHPLPASTSIRIWFFKEDMTDKNHKQRYRIKKLLYKATGKCWIKTPRRALGSRLHFLTTGEIYLDNFDCLNSSLSLFCFCFATNLRKKKIYGVRTLTVESPPSPHLSQYAFSWTTPPCLSVRTLWMTPKCMWPGVPRKHKHYLFQK